MKTTDDTERHELIAEFLLPIGFIHLGKGGFYHNYFGKEFIFDLSACGTKKWQIMQHIFDRAIEVGKDMKITEIKYVLDIRDK